ncbi:hypothetical protein DPMN_181840 [Dreissena polymorpha]|uniref:Uncharacterized protein n=1 Tax=Dreissena polymorpha TaxID=45954 RepID=A0A9D4I450_DREPO|nr:hypothetical protein DPMN_181840 [Dreissena polymorpha]
MDWGPVRSLVNGTGAWYRGPVRSEVPVTRNSPVRGTRDRSGHRSIPPVTRDRSGHPSSINSDRSGHQSPVNTTGHQGPVWSRSILPVTSQYYRSPVNTTGHRSSGTFPVTGQLSTVTGLVTGQYHRSPGTGPVTGQYYRSPVNTTSHRSIPLVTGQYHRSLGTGPVTGQSYQSPVNTTGHQGPVRSPVNTTGHR